MPGIYKLKMQSIIDTMHLEGKKNGVPVGSSLLSLEFKVASEVENAAGESPVWSHLIFKKFQRSG